MKRSIAVLVVLLFFLTGPALAAQQGRLLRFPDVYGDKIVFVYAGDIWSVPTSGGLAERLTTHPGLELFPKFSPDGKTIAFTGQYDGNFNVYIMPSDGGEPTQLTFTPDIHHVSERMGPNNMVIEWYPDGEHILFLSRRSTFNDWFGRYFKVSIGGGLPEQLVLPKGGLASFSPDGNKIAYNRIFRNFRTWKHYKGGMAQDVWIYDFPNNTIKRVTDWVGTDTYPMWHGDVIYFGSDRGPEQRMNLYKYDIKTGQTTQLTHFKEYDVNWPSIGDKAIVFENGGYLYLLDLATEQVRKVDVLLPSENLYAKPRWVDASKSIRSFELSPKGKRALFEARGDIYTVPAKEGATRNLTRTSGVHEKYPTWSPDGKWILYVSDASGEDELYLRPQKGGKEIRLTRNGKVFRFQPVWSPDSKKIAFADKNHNLWVLDVPTRKITFVDSTIWWEIRDYRWSPDSRWLAYSKAGKNGFYTIYLWSVEDHKIRPVTTEFTNDYGPMFDPKGRYMYFISHRNINPILGEFDGDYANVKTAGIYLVTLQADSTSPFSPKSDEAPEKTEKKESPTSKKTAKEKKAKKTEETKPIRIDFEGITTRAVALPIKPANIAGLAVTADAVFYRTVPVRGMNGKLPGEQSALHRFDLKEKKDEVILSPVDGFDIAPTLDKLIYKSGRTYGIIDVGKGKKKVGDGKLDLSHMKVKIDPRQEWRQMFYEAWRLERDYFYNPKMNGVDWEAMKHRYEVLLPYVAHRYDLNYVIGEMLGELGNSHTYVGGGDYPEIEHTPVGFLGAELQLDPKTGYYRIAKIYPGANWKKQRRSPLTEPGVKAHVGDYILAVDGVELKAPTNPYSLLENKVGVNVELTLNSKPTLDGSWKTTVKPIASEFELHLLDWVENNRKKVEGATKGQVGYIYLSDMSSRGLNEFIEEFYPQIRKKGLIIDVRYNGGGFVDYLILERLRRVLVGMGMSRNAADHPIPENVFHGHLVAICNHYSASDGDIFPYYFQKYKLGPVIGTRTWGGVRGIRGYLRLLDGGYITVPEFSIYGLDSKWVIENHGVDPDIVVDNRPDLVVKGRDPQLEKAIEVIMGKIKKEPKTFPPRPPYMPPYPEQ